MDFVHEHFDHQAELLRDHGEDRFFALFWEQGTGKTKSAIDQAAVLYARGEIDCLLVVAPNNVHLNWILTELPAHLPLSLRPQTSSFAYSTTKAGNVGHKQALRELYEHKGLAILAISYDSFSTANGLKVVKAFLKKRRCFYVADESHRIKNPKAVRTKAVVKTGVLAPYRRILTGTPIAQGPFDIYAPFKFLDPLFWHPHGLDSWTAFKHYFGVWTKGRGAGGREFDLLVAYQRLEELNKIIAPHSSRVLKDVLNLPPKLYAKRVFEMQPKQKQMYEEMRADCMTFLEREGNCPDCSAGYIDYQGHQFACTNCAATGKNPHMVISAPLAIVKLLRLQQITCGYVPDESGEPFHDIPGGNPRLDDCVSIIEDTPHQFLIWARFRRDVDKITDALGKSVLRFDGAIGVDERQRNKERFKGGEVQGLVLTPEVGGEGQTLTEARTNVYYSNSFKLLPRLQSEDRAHRYGQKFSVLCIDQCAKDTIDYPIIDALVEKRDIGSTILGDEILQWIRGI